MNFKVVKQMKDQALHILVCVVILNGKKIDWYKNDINLLKIIKY